MPLVSDKVTMVVVTKGYIIYVTLLTSHFTLITFSRNQNVGIPRRYFGQILGFLFWMKIPKFCFEFYKISFVVFRKELNSRPFDGFWWGQFGRNLYADKRCNILALQPYTLNP